MREDSAGREKILMCAVCWRAWDWAAANAPKGEYWVSLDDLLKSKMGEVDQYTLSEGYCPECVVALLQASYMTPSQEHRTYKDPAPRSLL